MRHSSKIIGLALALICVLVMDPAIADEQAGDSLILPLLETHGSPRMMNWGAVDYPRYDSASGLSLQDQNEDGVNELLVAGSYLHSFFLDETTGGAGQGYVNLGDEYGFGSEGLRSSWVRALDMNGDGKQDLVALDGFGTLRCFYGELNYYVLAQEETNLLAEWSKKWLLEATGDDVMDLVTSSKNGGSWIYPGLAEGGFSTQPSSIDIDVSALYITDGELSGQPGLWLSNSEGLWFRKNSDGDVEHVSEFPAWRLAAGDVNGDGAPDLVYWADDVLYVADTTTGFVVSQAIEADCNPAQIETGDFNGDGFDDVVVLLPPREYTYMLYISDGGLLPEQAWARSVTGLEAIDRGVNELEVGDYDGDGIDDLAFALDHSVGFAVSSAGFRLVQPLGGSLLLGSTDDGLLVDAPSNGIAHLKHMGGGRFEREVLAYETSAFSTVYMAMFADVQGDSVDELVALSYTGLGGAVSVWTKEDEGWTLAWRTEISGTMRPILLAADLLGDDKKEIVTGADEEVTIHSPPEEGATLPRYVSALPGETRTVSWGGPVGPMAVIPGDRKDAVVGFMVSEDQVLLKRLSGTWVASLNYELKGAAPLDLVVLDADGDEHLDLAVAALSVEGADTEEPSLTMQAGILYGGWLNSYHGEIEGIEGWPANAMSFPYGGMLAGDLTGDGLADIALMRRGGDAGTDASLFYLIGQEDGTLHPISSYQDIGQRLLPLDINEDGIPDIVYSGQGTPTAFSIAVWQRRWED